MATPEVIDGDIEAEDVSRAVDDSFLSIPTIHLRTVANATYSSTCF